MSVYFREIIAEESEEKTVKLDTLQLRDGFDLSLSEIQAEALNTAERIGEMKNWKVERVELVDQHESQGITTYLFDIYGKGTK